MATIRERNGRFTAMVRKAGHPTLTRTFDSRSKAEKWAAGRESRIEEGETFETNTYTLGDAIDRYVEDPDRTLKNFQLGVLDWWKNEAANRKGVLLGRKLLTQLRRSDFIEARDELRKLPSQTGDLLTPVTVNRRMSAISAVLINKNAISRIKTNEPKI